MPENIQSGTLRQGESNNLCLNGTVCTTVQWNYPFKVRKETPMKSPFYALDDSLAHFDTVRFCPVTRNFNLRLHLVREGEFYGNSIYCIILQHREIDIPVIIYYPFTSCVCAVYILVTPWNALLRKTCSPGIYRTINVYFLILYDNDSSAIWRDSTVNFVL